MAGGSLRWVLAAALLASVLVSGERGLKNETSTTESTPIVGISDYFWKAVNFLWQPDGSEYTHVWPPMEFGWKIIVGSLIAFVGAAFGSVGGIGGGGFFVPMLSLIIGFDPSPPRPCPSVRRFSTSEGMVLLCDNLGNLVYLNRIMIMGVAASTVYYNLKLRHPTLDMPVIDYDLAVLIQPMLMLGISIGVSFNVVFSDWMVTVLLITLFLLTATKAFLRGVDTWKKETIYKREAASRAALNGGSEGDYKALPSGPTNSQKETTKYKDSEVPILQNVCWKELGLLVFVWVAFLALQISKQGTETCSWLYWVLNLLQVPVAVGVSGFEAVGLFRGKRVLASKGDQSGNFKIHQLVCYCFFGMMAGVVGGLLGLGGGFVMGPLFLELGIPPQVSTATATFAMTFSASMSVVEYYLLKRFPVPYALYFVVVATIAALVGQHVVRRLINILGRASIIIFILAITIFISALSLGGVGISNMIHKIQNHEYMGFENLCKYKP